MAYNDSKKTCADLPMLKSHSWIEFTGFIAVKRSQPRAKQRDENNYLLNEQLAGSNQGSLCLVIGFFCLVSRLVLNHMDLVDLVQREEMHTSLMM